MPSEEVDVDRPQDQGQNPPPPRVRLVGVRPEHAELCWQWRQEPHARRANPYDDLTLEELATRFGSVGHDLSHRGFSVHRWMVEVDDLGLVGTVSVRPKWRMLHGEIGYQIGRQWGGRRFGRAAVTKLIDMAFTESKLIRLYATISVGNEASRRIVERLGFTHEGTLRRHHLIEGQYIDQWFYGLLREEWLDAQS